MAEIIARPYNVRMRHLLAVALLAVAVTVVGAQVTTPVVRMIDSPTAVSSEAPQLTVSERGVLLSWIERDGSRALLKFAERTADGWTPARTAASGSDWFVNWADVPSVQRLTDGSLVAHWLQKSGASTYAYDVRLARSTDDGQSWTSSVTPHHDGTQTEHGFASLMQMPGAGLGLVWLDGRQMTGGHEGHGEGAMSVRFATFDGNWKQTVEMPVDTRVCECCPTTAVVTSDGLLAAFRNRTEDETRDIHVSRFENGKWTESKAVHNDGWQIAACPVNGPMLSADGRNVAVAWFTGANDAEHVFAAFSKDAGRTWSSPIRLDDNKAIGRVDVEMMPDGSAIATWIEGLDGGAEFRARRIRPDGSRGAAFTIAKVAATRTSGYPRVARSGNELVFAWLDVGPSTPGQRPTTRVRTAVLR
jgi:hypothetical protein